MMDNIIKQSNTVQALWVGIGSLATFTFSLVSAAILSRILTKSEYGTYKQIMYVYNTLLVVFTLGLPKAYSYYLPKYNIEYGNSILNNQQLVHPLRLFAISPAFILPTMGIEGIMASYKKSDINAIYLFITRCLLLLFVLVPVLVKPNCNSAVLGFSIASIINCFIGLYLKRMPFKGVKTLDSDVTYREILRFSIPLMFASIGGILIKSADQFFVSRYCGTEIFADFANGSLDLPFVNMVLGAAATVLLPEFSRLLAKNSNNKDIVDKWSASAYKSALILYPLIIYCIFFSQQIMVLLYGSLYESSFVYFTIIMMVDLFMIAPYYPIIIALGSTGYYAKVHLLMSVIVWTIEYLTILVFQTAISLAIISAILQIIKIVIMTRYISLRLNVSILKLFPFKKLSNLILCNLISGLIAYFFTIYVIQDILLIMQLLISFMLFCLCSFCFGKLFGINYLTAIEPIYNKYVNK